jgi:Periplasmic binding protein/Cytochrome c
MRRDCREFLTAVLLLVSCAMTIAQPVNLSPGDVAMLQKGRDLYLGHQAFTGSVRMGSVNLPPAALTGGCAGCHGYRGEGGREAGVVAPAIQLARLRLPHAGNSPFDSEQRVMDAITHGLGRGGAALRAPMPQFSLTANEQQALMAYLRVLGTEAQSQPGVYQERIVLGAVVPLTGSQANIGERIKTTLMSRVDAVNSVGGVFGRRVELRVVDAGATAAAATKAARELVASQQVFALVASLVPEPDAELLQAVTKYGVPMVATLGVPAWDVSNRGISYLLPSLDHQISSLVNEMDRQCIRADSSDQTLVLQMDKLPVRPPAMVLPGKHIELRRVMNRASLIAELERSSASRIIAALPAAWVDVVRQHLLSSRPHSCLGTLAIWSGSQTVSVQTALQEVVAFPMPPVGQQTGVAASDTLWTLLAQVAMNTLMEALSRSGRQLDSAALLSAIDTISQFEALTGLAVSFNPQKSHGFEVTYIWKEGHHANIPASPR